MFDYNVTVVAPVGYASILITIAAVLANYVIKSIRN